MNSTPVHGSSASRRFPSRSTWSQRLAIWAAAEIPRPGLDHAAEHDVEVERPRGVGHPHCFPDPARFRELQVHAVCPLRAGGDIGEGETVLVDVDRDGRAALQLGPVRVARGKRLLAVLDRHLRQQLERLVERPVLVHVDLERQRCVASRTACTRVEVEPVAPAELQLEPLERLLLRRLRAARHVVGIAEPDGPRRRRPLAPEPEQLVHRDACELPLQVVERRVERGPRGGLTRRKRSFDLVERPGIVPELDGLQARQAPRRPSARTARSARPLRTRRHPRAEPRPRRPRRHPATRARS